MITRVERFPSPGETIHGQSFGISSGGKGANQAVALARLGASVDLVGIVGEDSFGKDYLKRLAEEGVGLEGLGVIEGATTGTATIEVTSNGENHIVIVGGANDYIDRKYVEGHAAIIRQSSLLLLQLEISIDAVIAAAEIASDAGIPVILDPAPACDLPSSLLARCRYVTPNEGEASILSGVDTSTPEGIRLAAEKLLDRGVGHVIVKVGSRGAYVVGRDGFELVPAMPVKAIDTVGAGDTFNAGLAFALSKGNHLVDAVRFANVAAALSTTAIGAQGGMPGGEEVRRNLIAYAGSGYGQSAKK
jgi:ribokinase